jgi:hypothetical protein
LLNKYKRRIEETIEDGMNFAGKTKGMKALSPNGIMRCSCGSQQWIPQPALRGHKPAPIIICGRCGRQQTVSRTTYALYRYLSSEYKVGQGFRDLYDLT